MRRLTQIIIRVLKSILPFIFKKKSTMKVKIKSICVGKGDCFFLCLEKEGKSFNIMVDCMKYNDKVKDFIEGTLYKHIDLLVVTHIDNDHVPGVTTMLNTEDDLEVGQIWFNCYQREPETPAQKLTDYQKNRLLQLKRNIPIIADVIDSKADVEDAQMLSEAILKYEDKIGKKVWKREYITTDLQDITLGKDGEWGTIHFLSPTEEAIQKLDKDFRKMFRNLFYEKYENPIEEDVSIYELMMMYLNQKKESSDNSVKIASSDCLSEQVFMNQANIEEEESRKENKASIAFIWSYDKHRVLFAGDASHEQLHSELSTGNIGNDKPILFDAIKVSHHGSNTGTSKKLMSLIDSEEYFIPCGTSKVPSMSTMAKIIARPLQDGISIRRIRYNKATENIRILHANKPKYTNLPNFELTDETEYEFTC